MKGYFKKAYKVLKSPRAHTLYMELCLSLLIFVGLAAFAYVNSALDPKSGAFLFLWQLVGFAFLIAAMVLTVPAASLSERRRRRFAKVGFLLILSGAVIVGGFGLIFVAAANTGTLLSKILMVLGAIFIYTALAFISWSLGVMGVIAADEAFGVPEADKN